MNIFVLDTNADKAARYQCDRHVVKMVLESTQLLMNCYDDAPYKRTHYNHPCSVWVRESYQNYQWLLEHAFSLASEYTARYNREHACYQKLLWVSWKNPNLPDIGQTPFVLCMPEKYKISGDAVASYRNFYNKDKSRFAKWKHGNVPEWFVNESYQSNTNKS